MPYGVSHLHSKGIIHHDLNGGNVLLSSDLHAKVADLCVSWVVSRRQLGPPVNTQNPEVQDYMAPEAIRSTPVYNHKLDCFLFDYFSICKLVSIEIYIVNRYQPIIKLHC